MSTVAFEACSDDGPFDRSAWAADGHHTPSLPVLLALGRAIADDTGYTPSEVKDLLRTVRFWTGYVGEHPSKYDLIPCAENGKAEQDEDDDGWPLQCTKVRPTTWAEVKI